MATDTHIKFDGIVGEATHESHKGEIEVLSWSHGISNGSQGAGGGAGRGKADPGEFSFLHLFDKASPIIMTKCASGTHFPTVILTSRKSGEGQKDFLKITMKEVFITSSQSSGGNGGDIHESVSMSYGDIEYDYKPQDQKGVMGGSVFFKWNVKTSKVSV